MVATEKPLWRRYSTQPVQQPQFGSFQTLTATAGSARDHLVVSITAEAIRPSTRRRDSQLVCTLIVPPLCPKSTRGPAQNIEKLCNLATLFAGVAADNRMLDAMRDVLTKHLFLDASKRRAHGRNLGDDVDAVAVFLEHAGKTAHLALDPAQPFKAGGLAMLAHS